MPPFDTRNAEAIIAATGRGTRTRPIRWTAGGLIYEVVEGPDVVPDGEPHAGFLRVVLQVTEPGGTEVPTDNPYYWQQPSTRVADGQSEREDPAGAFRQQVAEVARLIASQRGWRG